MANNISIAIIGLSLNTTNQIKNLLKCAVNNQYIINWTNIADKNLNLLIIGSHFTDSPAIQRINVQNLKILIVHHDEEKSNLIEQNHLHMPLEKVEILTEWLEQNKLIYSDIQTNKNDQVIDINQLDVLHTCLTQSEAQYFLCTINNTHQFIIDKKQQEVWIPTNFEIINLEKFDIQELTFNEVINHRTLKTKYELSVWLWNFLWETLSHTPSLENQYYQLTKWPQPAKPELKNCLKLAACFQYGSNAQYVQEYTNLESTFIKKFIYISYLCNLLVKTTESESKFKKQKVSENQSQIKSFFSKIRKKLGI